MAARINKRQEIIGRFCEKIGSPLLVKAFDDPNDTSIDIEMLKDFKMELLSVLVKEANGVKMGLPSNTNPIGVLEFVASDSCNIEHAKGLFMLGYRATWESPVLKNDQYTVNIQMLNGTLCTFTSGINDNFGMYQLWLHLRMFDKEPRRQNQQKPPSPKFDPMDYLNQMLNNKKY